MSFVQITAYAAAAFSLLITLPLAVLILARAPRDRRNQILFAYTMLLTFGLQVISTIVVASGTNLVMAWWAFRFAPLVMLTFPLYYLFARAYLGIKGESSFLYLTGFQTVVSLIAVVRPEWFFGIAFSETLGYYEFATYHWPFLAIFGSMFLWLLGIYHFWRAYEVEVIPIEQNRLRYLAIAPLFTVVGIVLIFIPAVHVLPFDMIGIAVSTAMLAYATLKHELMDIKIIVHQSGLYSGMVLLIMAMFILLGFLASLLTHSTLSSPVQPESLILVFLTALIVHYLYSNQGKIKHLIEEERKLKEMNEAIFVIAAHNLRTPLTAMSGYIEALVTDRAEFSESHQQLIDRLSDSTAKLLILVRQLLELPKLKSQGERLILKTIQLERLMSQIYTAFWPQAEAKGLSMSIQVPKESIFIRADARKIEFALMILVINALKYTTAGKITLVAEIKDRWVRVSVSDTGRGIARQDLEKLFEKFSQVGGYSSEWQGLGLSLYMMKSVIDAHGGLVGVDSKLGEGSIFWFKLPVEE